MRSLALRFWVTTLLACAGAAVAIAQELSLPLASAFPAASATNVCPDTPLRLTFPAPPTVGAHGTIQIVDTTDNSVADTIDVAAPTATQSIGGLGGFKYHPIVITGNQVAIFPKNGALARGRTYRVKIEAGVFIRDGQPYSALDAPAAWRFTTKSTAPAPGAARLVIAADGTGDFCTVQGALDFLPAGNKKPVTLFLRRGTYTEIIFFTDRHAVTLLGEDRKQTIIACTNNARLNDDFGGNPFGGTAPNPSAADVKTGPIYRRGLLIAHGCNDLTIANLTLRNTTPYGGSQAETIILNGTTTARAILKDVDCYSFQDTIQINGQAYLSNCHIEGDVDFMWGTGPCFSENCTARSVRSGAYYTQIRNPPTNHGYVYLHCTFDGAPDVTGNFLTRVQPSRFPASEVVLVDCTLTNAVNPIAWQFQAGPGGTGDTTRIHFWEANSHDATGQPIDASKRMTGSRQLKSPDDAATIADYRNPTFVLGNNWDPKAAPIFKTAGR